MATEQTSRPKIAISDLRYISILQYIDTVNKYRDTIMHLENCDTLIEQSVTALY